MSKKTETQIEKPEMKSADDLIVKIENEKLGITQPEVSAKLEEKNPVKQESLLQDKEDHPSNEEEKSADDQSEVELQLEEGEDKQAPQEKNKKEDAKADAPTDEVDDYGNPISPAKTYSEAEVQQMIRDRLKRGNHTEQQQQVQEATKDFKADPASEDSWETQLEGFIEKTLSKINSKQHETDWRKKEEATQAEFEDKFTSGMEKYSDFKDVVSNKPITNSMMLAARSMQDPAAFIYAACKQHPGEVERIAKLQDPVAQIAEVGRLEERMKKAKMITKAPAPPKKVLGDASSDMPKRSVDQLIQEHAKSKIMNVRR